MATRPNISFTSFPPAEQKPSGRKASKSGAMGIGVEELLARTSLAQHSQNMDNIFSVSPSASSPPPGSQASASFVRKSGFVHPGRRISGQSRSPDDSGQSPVMMGASSSHLSFNPSSSSLNSDQRSTGTRTIRVPLRRSIEHAFQKVRCGELVCLLKRSETNNSQLSGKVGVPAKFKQIYKSDVMYHFVNCVMAYVMAFNSGGLGVKGFGSKDRTARGSLSPVLSLNGDGDAESEATMIGEEEDDAVGGRSISPAFDQAATVERGQECLEVRHSES